VEFSQAGGLDSQVV